MAFMSSTSIRSSGKPFDTLDRATSRDSDRFNPRTLRRDTENEQVRDGRGGSLRPKYEGGESDNDGWSTVKPRKSFGTEGAERFNGRMGLDRHRDDRRFKDKDDRDAKERPLRGFDTFSRDKDGDHDQDRERDTRRNGTGRSRTESWFRTDGDAQLPARDRTSNGDKLADRNRGWREKDRDDKVVERGDRHDRGDRRWDRDQRQERDPEWMDEPADERNQAHTQEDFQKWKEQMQGKDKPAAARKAPVEESSDAVGFSATEKPKVDTVLAIDTGPDKFFGMWGTPKDDNGQNLSAVAKERSSKPQAIGKASRFTSFFTPQEETSQSQFESQPPAPPPSDGLGALFQNSAPDSREKAAFAELLQKLKGNSFTEPAPPMPSQQQPKVHPSDIQQNIPITSPEPPQQYRPGNQDDSRPTTRNSQPNIQSLLTQRQGAGSQPTIRQEQMLQELVGQRQNALSQSSSRPEQPQSRSNTEFLMNLMQSTKAATELPRNEQPPMRMPQSQKPADRQMQQQMMEAEMQREAAAQRERSASQRQARPPLHPASLKIRPHFSEGHLHNTIGSLSLPRYCHAPHQALSKDRHRGPSLACQGHHRNRCGLILLLLPAWGLAVLKCEIGACHRRLCNSKCSHLGSCLQE